MAIDSTVSMAGMRAAAAGNSTSKEQYFTSTEKSFTPTENSFTSKQNTYDIQNGFDSTVTMASANVRTLLPHQEDTSYNHTSAALMMSKVQMLEQQFIDNKLEVIGIQEGRSRHGVESSGFAYRMLTSCADHGGQYGNQFWFSFKSRLQLVTW